MLALSIIYTIAALIVALAGLSPTLTLVLYLYQKGSEWNRSRRHATSLVGDSLVAPPDPEVWPLVSVQLPVYNELNVIVRLIDTIVGLDYPRDRLQIQVLDDSTDETTQVAQARVDHYRSLGVNIELVRRIDRKGFKAGNLANGFKTAQGEFIALFDADFMPPDDFLRRTIPYIVADPRLAFVQTRWGHLNGTHCAVTRAQTLALDGHFVVQQWTRSRTGLVMTFNGTAGVWRRLAIEDAGGWQTNTLIEDMDLSFRAQLAGWRVLFLPNIVSPGEVPPQVTAYRRQQARQSTGAAQCLVKLGPAMFLGRLSQSLRMRGRGMVSPSAPGPSHRTENSRPAPANWDSLNLPTSIESASVPRRRLPLAVRLEALIRMCGWVAYPCSLVVLIMAPLLVLGKLGLAVDTGFLFPMSIAPFVTFAIGQQQLYSDWKQRLVYLPILTMIGTGLGFSNVAAVVKGLFGRGLDFRRTPKFGVREKGDQWTARVYVIQFERVTLGELVLAIYAWAAMGIGLTLGNYKAVAPLILYAAGYSFMAYSGLRDAWPGWRERLRRSDGRWSRTQEPAHQMDKHS